MECGWRVWIIHARPFGPLDRGLVWSNSNGHRTTNAASKSASNTWGTVPGSSKPLSPGYSASPLSWRFFADTTSTSTAFALMTRGHGFTRQRINSTCRYFCLFKQFQPTSPYLFFVLDVSTILPAFRPIYSYPRVSKGFSTLCGIFAKLSLVI